MPSPESKLVQEVQEVQEEELDEAETRARARADRDPWRYETEEPRELPWSPEAWDAIRRQTIANGWKPRPETRYPVILTPDGPISSAAKLRQLAELETLPETIETAQVDWSDESEIKKVVISHVNYDGMEKMEAKAKVLSGLGEWTCVRFRGKKRFAATVLALNEGVTLED